MAQMGPGDYWLADSNDLRRLGSPRNKIIPVYIDCATTLHCLHVGITSLKNTPRKTVVNRSDNKAKHGNSFVIHKRFSQTRKRLEIYLKSNIEKSLRKNNAFGCDVNTVKMNQHVNYLSRR